MNTQQIHFEQLKETLFYEKMDNGLDVYVLPKHGFNKIYATFTTKYGSIDNHFRALDGNDTRVPDGIAHFLEHKMFESEKGDVFHEFSQYGAQANAFTSFDRTAYLFSCTSHVKKNLKTLINFVQEPHFTDENVEKEKGIIEQEIRMYDDNPDWRLYFGYLEALYHQFPVKINIAGTVESIYETTKEALYTCYETFYHPSNMLLFVVGPIEPKDIFTLVRENQEHKSFPDAPNIERYFEEEPNSVANRLNEINMGVGTPKVMMGYKESASGLQGEAMLKQELLTSILLDMIIGPSSSVYEQLMQEGLIDDTFGAEYQLEKDYGFSAFGGNTNNPDELINKVQQAFQQAKAAGVNVDDFERTRKKKIGSFLKALNSPEYIANQFTRYQFNEMNLFDAIPMLEKITFEDVQQRLQTHVNDEQLAICVVK